MASNKIVRFLRHGQAAHNVNAEAMRAAGCSYDEFLSAMAADDVFDAALTPLGREQAAVAGRSPACLRAARTVELVVASPLSRAIDTADLCFPAPTLAAAEDALWGARRAVPRLVKEEAREISGLLLNGKRRTRTELAALYPHWEMGALVEDEDAHWVAVGGSAQLEEDASTARRAHKLLAWVWDRPERDVVVVAHGGLFHLLANGANSNTTDTDTDPSPAVEACEGVKQRFANCELRSCRLEAMEGRFRLSLLSN